MPRFHPLGTVAVLIATLAWGCPVAHATNMAKAHLPKKPFKIYKGNLSAEQQLCLRYALKQWVMYDEAPEADGKGNRNESHDHVTEAGPKHVMDDVVDRKHPEKSHARSSRSLSKWEKKKMAETYGASSPFHGQGDTVRDPVVDDSWFTNDESAADLNIKPVGGVPGVAAKTMGLTLFDLTPGVSELGVNIEFKTRWKDSSAVIHLKQDPPPGKTWCYPTDTNGDGFITNADAKCPPNTYDYYMLVKHELGHWFSFEHDDCRFELPDDPVPALQTPASLCDSAMSPAHDLGPAVAFGSEFGPRASRLYFASDRPGGHGGYDLWVVTWDSDESRYKHPINCGPVVNTAFDELDPHSGIGDVELYFSSNRPGGAGGFDLYRATRGAPSSWDTLETLTSVNTSANETGPCTYQDLLLYASDAPGGAGGLDLHAALLDGHLLPGPGTNLGTDVNTMFDETDPVVSKADTLGPVQLMFASNRLGGLGGYDLYSQNLTGPLPAPLSRAPASARVSGGQRATAVWSPAVNLAAVNSPFHETGPSPDIRLDRLFLDSNRPGGHGGYDCFASENHVPHPAVLWVDDAIAAPDSVARLQFDVVNSGSTWVMLQPQAFDSRGWGVQVDPAPFILQPGELRSVDVDVHASPAASQGDSSEVWYGVMPIGQGLVATPSSANALPFPANHAYVVVQPLVDVPPSSGPQRLAVRAQPNPTAGMTRLVVDVPLAGHGTVEIFDLLGRRVRTLARGPLGEGPLTFEWDGRDDGGHAFRAGLFICRVAVGAARASVVVVRVD